MEKRKRPSDKSRVSSEISKIHIRFISEAESLILFPLEDFVCPVRPVLLKCAAVFAAGTFTGNVLID